MNARIRKFGLPAAFLLLSALTWFYIWLRAYHVQFSIDEAATFYMYIQTGRFIPPFSTIDANNHILNSLLSWCCFRIFGPHPLAMRLPNVLAALVFFYFTWKITCGFKQTWSRWAFITLSLGTHFLIEFFGYARGYGLSMAFLSGAIWYTLRLYNHYRLSTFFKANMAIALLVLANFNLIFTALPLLLLIAAILWSNRHLISMKNRVTIILTYVLAVIPVMGYVIFAAFAIRTHNGYYYGSGEGFLVVTVKSLVVWLTGKSWLPEIIYIISLFAILVFYLVFNYLKSESNRSSLIPALGILFIILANWLGSLCLNFVWGVNFQEDRAAMHFIPLFFLFVCFSMDSLVKTGKSYAWLSLLPLLIIPVHSFSRLSLDSSIYGVRQQIPRSDFEHILKISGDREIPPVISAWQTRKQPWAFLNYQMGGQLNPIQSSGYPSAFADFIIVEEEMADSVPEGFRVFSRNNETRTILYERKEPLKRKIWEISRLDKAIPSNKKFTNLFSLPLDADSIRNVWVDMDYWVSGTSVPFEAVFVVEVFDPNRKTLIYEAIDLDQLKPEWGPEPGNFRHSLLITGIPPEAESLLFYFWNKNQVSFIIDEGEMKIYF